MATAAPSERCGGGVRGEAEADRGNDVVRLEMVRKVADF